MVTTCTHVNMCGHIICYSEACFADSSQLWAVILYREVSLLKGSVPCSCIWSLYGGGLVVSVCCIVILGKPLQFPSYINDLS